VYYNIGRHTHPYGRVAHRHMTGETIERVLPWRRGSLAVGAQHGQHNGDLSPYVFGCAHGSSRQQTKCLDSAVGAWCIIILLGHRCGAHVSLLIASMMCLDPNVKLLRTWRGMTSLVFYLLHVVPCGKFGWKRVPVRVSCCVLYRRRKNPYDGKYICVCIWVQLHTI
jgi:hypothetical protein